MLTRLSSMIFLLKFLMLTVLASFTCSRDDIRNIFPFNGQSLQIRVILIHQRISNFSMPENIINHNDTPGPHLQQETKCISYKLLKEN